LFSNFISTFSNVWQIYSFLHQNPVNCYIQCDKDLKLKKTNYAYLVYAVLNNKKTICYLFVWSIWCTIDPMKILRYGAIQLIWDTIKGSIKYHMHYNTFFRNCFNDFLFCFKAILHFKRFLLCNHLTVSCL
jgi:hypothetical protein